MAAEGLIRHRAVTEEKRGGVLRGTSSSSRQGGAASPEAGNRCAQLRIVSHCWWITGQAPDAEKEAAEAWPTDPRFFSLRRRSQ